MDENDDSILVALSRKGEISAFAALFSKYHPRLLKHIGRVLPNRADAEDVVQDAFLNAFRAISEFREDSCFFTWIYRIAMNRAFSSVRNYNRRIPVSQFSVLSDDGYDQMSALSSETDNPAEVVHTNRMLIKIDHQLSNMPRIFSDAFLLREVNGLSYEEISDQMHCSVGTVRSRLFRARQIINAGLQSM